MTRFVKNNSYNYKGTIAINNASANASLDLSQQTDGIILPKGNTAQRPSSPIAGMIRYNTTRSEEHTSELQSH